VAKLENRIQERFDEVCAAHKEKTGHDLTQGDFANACGVDPSTFSRYLNDRVDRFDRKTIEKLCNAFKCNIDGLFTVTLDD
jgi:transcriptional regulator with XRE-family HTH domain